MPNPPEQEPRIPQQDAETTPSEPTPAEIDMQNAEADGIKIKALLAATGIAAIGLSVAIFTVDRARRKGEQGENKEKKAKQRRISRIRGVFKHRRK